MQICINKKHIDGCGGHLADAAKHIPSLNMLSARIGTYGERLVGPREQKQSHKCHTNDAEKYDSARSNTKILCAQD